MTSLLRTTLIAAFLLVISATTTWAQDLDGDGIDNALEDALAAQFFPPVYIHTLDNCSGPQPNKPVVFRARHPKLNGVTDTRFIAITYVLLYAEDCGFGGHSGDNESFMVFIESPQEGFWGFQSESATAHWDATCETRSWSNYPDIYVGRNKHGSYANIWDCGCFGGDECDSNFLYPLSVQLYNAGEPDSPLTNHLGDVNNDWQGYYVWDGGQFLDAGVIRDQMFMTRYAVMSFPYEINSCYDDCYNTWQTCTDACGGDVVCAEACEQQFNSCYNGCQVNYRWDYGS